MLELRDGLRLSEVLEVPVELEDGLTDALGETDGVTLPLGEELAV